MPFGDNCTRPKYCSCLRVLSAGPVKVEHHIAGTVAELVGKGCFVEIAAAAAAAGNHIVLVVAVAAVAVGHKRLVDQSSGSGSVGS